METAKNIQLEQHITRERHKLEEIRNILDYMDMQREEIQKRIVDLNGDLKTRQGSIDLLKGRLKNQITSFKETIAKVLDKGNSLAEKIQMLFQEQEITIASILTAIGMAVGVLVEVLLPGGTADTTGKPPPKDEKGAKNGLETNSKPWHHYQGD